MSKSLKNKDLKKVSGGENSKVFYFRLHNLDTGEYSSWSEISYPSSQEAYQAGLDKISTSTPGRYEIEIKGAGKTPAVKAVM